MSIWIALTVRQPWQKRAVGVDIERSRVHVINDLVHEIMGAPKGQAVLLIPETCGASSFDIAGYWGEDQPHPFPTCHT